MKGRGLVLVGCLTLFSWAGFADEDLSDMAECRHTNSQFRCVKFQHNHDGDTATFNIPVVHPLLGEQISIRVSGIDAPEMDSDNPCEQRKAREAQEEMNALLATAKRINLTHVSRDKYFRILADIEVDGESVGEHMLKSKLAVPYDGGTKKKVNWCRH